MKQNVLAGDTFWGQFACSRTATAHARPRARAHAGETIAVEVPTHTATVLRLASGALAKLTVSYEATGQYLSGLVVHGSTGSLVLPDANEFGGEVVLWSGREERAVRYEAKAAQETRGLGIDELAQALAAGRPHRAGAELALHVLEVAEAAVQAVATRTVVDVPPIGPPS